MEKNSFDAANITIPQTGTSKEVSPTNTVVDAKIDTTASPNKDTVYLATDDLEKQTDTLSQTSNAAGPAVDLPRGIRMALTFGLSMIVFLAGLDNFISSTAMPAIGTAFNDLNNVPWVASAYIVTFNAFIPLVGKFADVFGRRPIIYFGLITFLVGSAIAGASQNMVMLILMRAVQGVGGGFVFACILIVFADISRLEDRALYQGLVGIIFSIASVLGPLIGGAFVDHVTWRWGFYINLPIGALAFVTLLFTLRLPTVKGSLLGKLKRLDYIGTAFILSAVVFILLGVTWGGTRYAWSSPIIIVLLILFALCVIGLIVHEIKWAVEPIIPPHLFKIRTAVAVYVGGPFFCMMFFSLMYFLPIFWQVAKKDSATSSGLRLIPMPIGLLISSYLAAFIAPRYGRIREMLVFGAVCGTVAVGLISTFKADDSLGKETGYLLLFGFGLGILWSLSVVAVQSATEVKDLATATALVNFFQMLGGAVGVGITSTVFFSHLGDDLGKFLSPDETFLAKNSVSYVHHMPDDLQNQVIDAYVNALQQVWYVQTVLGGISVIALSFTKNHSLKQEEAVISGGM